MLRAHPWNCAIKRVILSPDVEMPAFGYTYQFTLPADWIRTLSVGEYGEEIDRSEDGIVADTDTLKLRYVFHNKNEGTWGRRISRIHDAGDGCPHGLCDHPVGQPRRTARA